ncbi:MAG: hypothetical protein JXR84_13290 [Anaerolineae bacterium]|nr:hypothetical protein [Anaerolineae bacterium]
MPICRTCRGQYDSKELPRSLSDASAASTEDASSASGPQFCPRCGSDVSVWERLAITLPEFIVWEGGVLALLPAAAPMIVWLFWIPQEEWGIYFPVLTFICLAMCGLLFYFIYESRLFWWERWWAQQVYQTSGTSIDLLIAITAIGGLLFSMLWILYYASKGRPDELTSKAFFAVSYVSGFACLTAAVALIIVNEYVEQLKARAPAPIFVSTERLLRVVVEEAINSINLNGLGANTPVKCAGTNSVYEVYQALRMPEAGGVHVLLRECKCVEHPTADGKPQGKLMEMLWRVEADRWGRLQLLRPGSLEPYDVDKRVFREIGRYSY